MAYGLAALDPWMAAVMQWAERSPQKTRVESETATAAAERSGADGARVEDAAIRLRVERAREGDSEALGELFGELRPDVLGLCTRLLGSVDAEDAVNEAFQRAQRRLTGYDPTRPFRTWLLSIASHHCIDRLRRRSVEKRLFDPGDADVEDLAAHTSSALDGLVRAERQAAVQEAVDRLPERYRAPLVLRYLAELGYDAIAEELGITRAQVATSLFRGKQRLRDTLRGEQENES